jgi:hypothetical protein
MGLHSLLQGQLYFTFYLSPHLLQISEGFTVYAKCTQKSVSCREVVLNLCATMAW